MTAHDKHTHREDARPDLVATWVIGVYLVLWVTLLGFVGVVFWLATDIKQLLSFPLYPPGFDFLRETMSADKFGPFRQLALAACSASAGGAVFMIREFYISVAYGFEKDGVRTYLKNREIPRYVLLPFSAGILGPISIFLLQAGSIVFAGFSENNIPDYTIMVVSFLFGFSYHDSLKALRNLSKKMFGGETNQKING